MNQPCGGGDDLRVVRAGKSRTLMTDGLGRLVGVIENPGAACQAAGSDGIVSNCPLNYKTTYAYDALDSLVAVNQSGLTRSFLYDSLKRLSCANNLENSTPSAPPTQPCSDNNKYPVSYAYDRNGNLLAKTDNRGDSMSYAYDQLNRVKTKIYFNKAINVQQTSYSYDDANIAYSKGHLTAISTIASSLMSDASSTNYLTFDALGRVTSSSQTTAGTVYTFKNYSYNLAGARTNDSGNCLSSCDGYGFASSNADWLKSQLRGNSVPKDGSDSLDGLLAFMTKRDQPVSAFWRIMAGPLNPQSDNWAGPGGMGPPGGTGDWRAAVHDYNFFTNHHHDPEHWILF